MQSNFTSSPAFHPEESGIENSVAVRVAFSRTDMAERQSAAVARSYKRLCDVIILAPIVQVDGDDRERYSIICTHQTRGLLGPQCSKSMMFVFYQPTRIAPVPAGWGSATGQPSGDRHPSWSIGFRGNQQGNLQGEESGGDSGSMDRRNHEQTWAGAALQGIPIFNAQFLLSGNTFRCTINHMCYTPVGNLPTASLMVSLQPCEQDADC